MDSLEALFILQHSPEIIAKDIKSFIYGFWDSKKNLRRETSYFDLFLFYPLYSYQPAKIFFDKRMSLGQGHQTNFFIDKTNENPEIYASFQKDFYATRHLTKKAILYGIDQKYFQIDDDMNVSLLKKTVSDKNRVAENIGKLYSTQSTAYLYNFFKVDINAV